MTIPMQHNEDTILLEKVYPQEWQKWLELPCPGTLFTNQEVLENREYDTFGEWFNPFTEPEKLTAQRLECDVRPKQWRDFVEENYPGVNAKEQYQLRKEEIHQKEIADCGKPITIWDARHGCLLEVKRRCKHYKDCPQCGNWKRSEERKILDGLQDKTRYVECYQDEEKNIIRKYGKNNVRRIPLDDGSTGIVIKTDEEIGEVFTEDIKRKLVENCIPTDGRRISGKLGNPSSAAPKKDNAEIEMSWEEIERETEDPEVEYHYREMRIEYDSEDENAPQNARELTAMVQNEVSIDKMPSNEFELQDGIFVCEQMTQTICSRYNMSFNFLVRKKKHIRISEIDWHWLKKPKNT